MLYMNMFRIWLEDVNSCIRFKYVITWFFLILVIKWNSVLSKKDNLLSFCLIFINNKCNFRFNLYIITQH